jgi:hypothetical protein
MMMFLRPIRQYSVVVTQIRRQSSVKTHGGRDLNTSFPTIILLQNISKPCLQNGGGFDQILPCVKIIVEVMFVIKFVRDFPCNCAHEFKQMIEASVFN